MSELKNRRFVYGRRQGHRLHPRQARLVEDLLPQLSFALEQATRLETCFAKPCKKFVLEIGFGGGEHLAARAKAHPDSGFIGCEPFLNGVAKLLLSISEENLENIRIYHDDARNVLEALAPETLDEIYLLYPDPWHKLRHNKRRFVSQENLQSLFRALKPGGQLLVASDIPDYVSWTLNHVRRHGGFTWQAAQLDDWDAPPADWPGTRYEAKAVAAGRHPCYLRFHRRDSEKPGFL